MRHRLVVLHRWVGLATAAFLIVAGLTGSIIAFNHELDAWLNPELFHVWEPGAVIPPLDLVTWVEQAEPRLRVAYVPLQTEPGDALVLGVAGRVNPASGELFDLGYDEVFVNPITGAWLGERQWGACCLARKQLIPFIYSVHYTLHMPGYWGVWLMGAIAAAWAIDCFVGLYLTLPRAVGRPKGSRDDREPRQGFWQRWKPAWRVKLDARPYRINFDVHRAAGLWLWSLLLMLAVTAFSMNLHFEIFRPALSLVSSLTSSPFDPARAQTPVEPAVPFTTVLARATDYASARGWKAPFDVFYYQEFGLYGVGFGDHHAPGIGVPYVYFDRDGNTIAQTTPGQGSAGDVIIQSMFPLHSGQIIGLPGRIAICLVGLVTTVLSLTGVVIWAKKRKGRRTIAARRADSGLRTAAQTGHRALASPKTGLCEDRDTAISTSPTRCLSRVFNDE